MTVGLVTTEKRGEKARERAMRLHPPAGEEEQC